MINTGAVANDPNADTIRTGFEKTNAAINDVETAKTDIDNLESLKADKDAFLALKAQVEALVLSAGGLLVPGMMMWWKNPLSQIPAKWRQVTEANGRYIRMAASDVQLGTTLAESTKMPDNPFIVLLSGGHTHTVDVEAGGAHGHTASATSNGSHTHTGNTSQVSVGSAGYRLLEIDSGVNVFTDARGSAEAGTGSGAAVATDADATINEVTGLHSHTLSIDAAGTHTHAITVNAVGSHTHVGTTNYDGAHFHNLSGGDEETRPNTVYYYLIEYTGV